MSRERLSRHSVLPEGVAVPGYDPEAHGVGIVHLGLGAFHRAHQAVYTDDALAAEGGDWRICGVSLRSAAAAEELAPQDGRYTLIERRPEGPCARVIGSVGAALHAPSDEAALLAALTAPATRIVSLTVTEKGYGIDRASGGADRADPVVAADLAAPERATGVLGRLVGALKARRAAGVAPFAVLSCDNLPENGRAVRGAVVDFARAVDADLGAFVAGEVAFPSTMVDRITPARTAATLEDAAWLTGCEDRAAIETEPFSQWVVEDAFPGGRPAWDAGGAVFVSDVRPYELMKLRMLNGAHSLIAYCGVVAGYETVRDAMAVPAMRALVERHFGAAAATVPPVPGIDLEAYAGDLVARFANPEIAHRTAQIAMDGTQKLPQRILAPALAAREAGGAVRPFAFALAAWMRFCTARTDAGETYAVADPRQEAIAAAVAAAGDPDALAAGLLRVCSAESPLAADAAFMAEVSAILRTMLGGMGAAIEAEARG